MATGVGALETGPGVSVTISKRRVSLAEFVYRVVTCQVVTYFLAGAGAFYLLDYRTLFHSEPLAHYMRPISSPWVAAGPALQVFRGLVFALALWPFRRVLLDAVSHGLRNLDRVQLDELPRLADFAVWVMACEGALPWPEGSFLKAYAGNQSGMDALAIESSPVAMEVLSFVRERRAAWKGTAKDLLATLISRLRGRTADRADARLRAFPSTPSVLSNQLRRVAPNLRQLGVDIIIGVREGKDRNRFITISWAGETPSAASATSAQPGPNAAASAYPGEIGGRRVAPQKGVCLGWGQFGVYYIAS
jgi:hypothetical protein